MTHWRAAYRDAVATALAAAPQLSGFRQIDAWAQKVDPSQCPCFGIATPREASSRQGGSTVHRVTTLQLAAKIAGGAEIEADADDLSLVLEAAVLPVLDVPVAHIVELSSTSVSIDGSGGQRIATLLMEFSVTRFTDAGAAS